VASDTPDCPVVMVVPEKEKIKKIDIRCHKKYSRIKPFVFVVLMTVSDHKTQRTNSNYYLTQ